MHKPNHFEVLADWNFWGNNQIDLGQKRIKYLAALNKLVELKEIISVSGVRRCGKSTVLLQLIEELHESKKIPYENCLYINFEDPRLGEKLQAEQLFELLEVYTTHIKPKDKIYLFLDEVQNVTSWEKFCRTIYDQQKNIKVFVTGSTSKTFNSDLSSLLSGRMINFTITPLDFAEFLEFKKISPNLNKINSYFDEYLKFGGFPRVVLEKDEMNKRSILISYYETIIEKDVILKYDIRNKTELKNIARYALSNIGKQISSYALEKTLQISSENISRYLSYLEDSFIISRTPLFSYSVKKQIYNPDKIFSVDTGLSNVVGFNFSENRGRLLENVVFQKISKTGNNVYYWKEKTEVDFLTFEQNVVKNLINVTETVDNADVLARELKSLSDGQNEYPQAKPILLTLYNQSRQVHQNIQMLLPFLTG